MPATPVSSSTDATGGATRACRAPPGPADPPEVTVAAVVIDEDLAAEPAVGPLLRALTDAGVHVAVAGPCGGAALAAFRDVVDRAGIGPGLVAVVGPDADVGTAAWDGWDRARRVVVGGAQAAVAALCDQLDRRAAARVPWIDEDPAWTLHTDTDVDGRAPRVEESLLTIANGRFGARGAREGDVEGRSLVFAAGVFDGADANPVLLEAPMWTGLVTNGLEGATERRVLDLRTGVLVRECRLNGERILRTIRFLSLARPHAAGLRAEGRTSKVAAGRALHLPSSAPHAGHVVDGGGERAWSEGRSGGGITVAARTVERRAGRRRTIDRLAAYSASAAPRHAGAAVSEQLAEFERLGFDRLLAEHRRAWAARWAGAFVAIDGDPELERAARLAVFHLIGSVASDGEAAVGPRGMSGESYGGHVLWDAEIFVLPALAATHPPAARAMLEYRLRRLPAARAFAAAGGFAGARFPWESGADGSDVTPHLVRRSGQIVPILTGQHEEHVVADVAWAASHYADWSGDGAFLAGEGGALLVDTARYWASRVRWIGESAHVFGVVGPDEYHEVVDDNAFTNVMARWNLRRAAALVGSGDEAREWRRVADALVDGYDPASGLYEQCAGFWGLESVKIGEHHALPVMADEVLGRQRVRRTQVVKQPDVLMLHHLVPDEVAPGSLEANLDFYLPRTAHGSSLSPAIHAALLARAGRADEALELFGLACRLDLDDLTGTTKGGLHTATMGGVWQALAYGFAGLWPAGDALRVEPNLPAAWRSVTVTVCFRGRRVEVRAGHDTVEIRSDGPVTVDLAGRRHMVRPPVEVLARR